MRQMRTRKQRKKNYLSDKYRNYIASIEWQAFRNLILKERGRKCEKCGVSQVKLQVHHLTYVNLGHEKFEDVQVLCKPCHDAIHFPPLSQRRQEDPLPEFIRWFSKSLRRDGLESLSQSLVKR
jgi:5-methylcytosine-specific restriction endonuclease McrA